MEKVTRTEAAFFDFDGVLAESLAIKEAAFTKLFETHGPDVVSKVLGYHNAHAGISRVEKIDWAYREILDSPLTQANLKALCQQFSDLVEEGVSRCDWVLGAKEFLEEYHGKLDMFVISGTPEEELRRITDARQMSHYFRGIFGSPRHKDVIIRAINEKYGYAPGNILFVGDGETDYTAAKVTGLKFVGRVAPGDETPFPPGTREYPDLQELSTEINR